MEKRLLLTSSRPSLWVFTAGNVATATQKLKQNTASRHCSRPLAGPEELSNQPNTSATAYIIFVSEPELRVGKDESVTKAPACNSSVHRSPSQLCHTFPAYLCHRSGFCPRAVVGAGPYPTLCLQVTLAMAQRGHSHTRPGNYTPGARASLSTTSHIQPWPQTPHQAAYLESPGPHGQNATNGVTSTQVHTPGQGLQGII